MTRSPLLAWMHRHPVALYLLLAFGLTWAWWLPLAAHGARVVPGDWPTHIPGLLGPALAALIVTAATRGRAGLKALARRAVQIGSPLHFAAWAASPLLFLAAALALMAAAGQPLPAWADFGVYSGVPRIAPGWVLLIVWLCNGYGEELGWRGFLLGPLQQRFGTWRGTLLLAAVWAAWHAPAFVFVDGYRQMGVAGLVGGFGLGLCAGAIVLAHVHAATGGSVAAVALWHALYNFSSATAAGHGLVGAVTTTAVMAWAAGLAALEWRRPRARSRLQAPAEAALSSPRPAPRP